MHVINVNLLCDFLIFLCFVAVKTRRHHKKLKKDDEMNVPLSAVLAPLSDSWRRRYERLRTTSFLVGDHRFQQLSSPIGNIYPYFDSKNISERINENGGSDPNYNLRLFASTLYPWMTKSNKSSSTNKESNASESMHTNVAASSDSSSDNIEYNKEITHDKLEGASDFIETWKEILLNGQNAMALSDKKLASLKDYAKIPSVRNLLVLIGKAYSLPKPEDVFGRRDPITKQISQCLNYILDEIEKARGVLAILTDFVFDEDDNGIDLNKLRETMNRCREKCSVQIEEFSIVQDMLEEACAWESKLGQSPLQEEEDDSSVSENLHLPAQSLASAEELALSGRSLSLRPQSLVILDDRIERAYDLRNRIREWSNSVSNFKSTNDSQCSLFITLTTFL